MQQDRCELQKGLGTKSSDALDGGSQVGRNFESSRGADQMSMALSITIRRWPRNEAIRMRVPMKSVGQFLWSVSVRHQVTKLAKT